MFGRRVAVLVLVAASLVVAPWQASAGGSAGGRSGDFTVDRVPDVLARVAADGRLVVYPRTYGTGLATFASPVTINGGWGGMRWIGAGDINGSGQPYYYQNDVVSVDHAGVMRVALHRGAFDGTNTLDPQVVVGTGWHINDLIHTTPFYNDGLRDGILARRKGTGDTYLYRNTGQLGLGLFEPPELLFTGRQNDVVQAISRFTGDSVPDLLFVDTAGRLGVFDPVVGRTYWLGTGWQTVDSITLVEPVSGEDDHLMARRRSDGALLSYRRTTHTWEPAPDGTAYHIYAAPEVIGHNWHINDIIT